MDRVAVVWKHSMLLCDQNLHRLKTRMWSRQATAHHCCGCRYRTPNLTDIDQQGLHPDQSCSNMGPTMGPGAVPITDDAVRGMDSRLALDSCVLTAENFLDEQLGIATVTTEEHGTLGKTLLVGKE